MVTLYFSALCISGCLVKNSRKLAVIEKRALLDVEPFGC